GERGRRGRGARWSGVGRACAYAGGLSPEQLPGLKEAAGCYVPGVALGAAFAAKAGQRAGTPAAHTEIACQVLCGISATEAAAVTDSALGEINPDGEVPTYELWRTRVASIFGPRERMTV